MEPVGLAVGIVGLAGLFSTCLEALDKFDSYKDFGTDFRHLAAQFYADKHRLEKWGEAVGVLRDQTLDSDPHPAFSDPKTHSTVEKLLTSIKEIGSDADDAFLPPNSGSDTRFPRYQLLSRNQVEPHRSAPSESKRAKLWWALRDKEKRIFQVQQFGRLVQSLHDLVPPDGTKSACTRAGHGGPWAGNHAAGCSNSAYQTADAKDWIAEWQRFLAKLEEEDEAEKRREMGSWLLNGYNPNELYDNAIQKWLEGTCDWILDRPAYRKWVSSDFPEGYKLLWINGHAGFGKTILCARMIAHLVSDLETPVAHFFFSDFESRGQDGGLYVAIRSWIFQLLSHSKALEAVYDAYQAHVGQPATRALVIKMFRNIVQAIPECTFILDGLDEYTWVGENWKVDDIDSVARFLKTLGQVVADTNTRILIVSRDEPDIRQGLGGNASKNLFEYKISTEDVRPDTALYSRSIVDRKLCKKPEATKTDITQKMVDRAHGQFLWVKMQADNLRSGRNKKQIEEAIDNTPTALACLYDRNWKRICQLQDADRSRAFSLLRWTAFSVRPLTVREITEAVLVNDTCNDFPIDEMPDSIDEEYINTEILGLCGSLLDIQSVASQTDVGSRTVYLAHFSIKEYIVLNMSTHGILIANGRLSFSKEALQSSLLAQLCLRYVNFRRVWQETPQRDGDEVQWAFRDYAAGSWYQHPAMSFPSYPDTVSLINTFFNTSNENWHSWRAWFDQNDTELKKTGETDLSAASPLYYASRLGLVETIKDLVQKRAYDPKENPDALRTALGAACMKGNSTIVDLLLQAGASIADKDTDGRTPLYLAASNGHHNVVKMLLEKGADVNIANKNGWTPLNSATAHVEVVKMLLEKGADFTIADEDEWTPLNSASDRGHVEVVKMLLEKGADITITSKNRWTALNSAANNGHIEVVKMLLEKGADITIASMKGWTPLKSAASNGHVEVVKMLLEKGADFTIATETGFTPLQSASSNGHVEVVKMLLEKGADFTIASENSWTPLHSASDSGHIVVVKMLLEKGADINITSKNGWTPLNTASDSGHIEVVEMLLGKGADSTITTEDGFTPLNSALGNKHVEVAKMLLKKGANFTVATKKEHTPLNSAASNGYVDVVKMLLEMGADSSIANTAGWTPLMSACYQGYVEVVKLLLDKNADISIADTTGWTPLNSASNRGYVEVVKLLLEKGADIDIANTAGWTPLNSASNCGYVEVVRLLLEKGADIDVANTAGWTPLMSACYRGYVEVVELLLEKGADINVATEHRLTPLLCACSEGHIEVVKMLLEKGADISIANVHGLTPLLCVCHQGHIEIVKILLEKGAGIGIAGEDECTPLLSACCEGHIEIIKMLLEKGADISIKNKHGWTPVHLACHNGHFEVVKMFFEKDVDIAIVTKTGETLVNVACHNGHVEVVKMLLGKGADISIADNAGWTPLLLACSHGNVEMVKMLLERGADITTTKAGQTLVHVACQKGHVEVVKMFLEEGIDTKMLLEKDTASTIAENQAPALSLCGATGGRVHPVKVLQESMDPNISDIKGRTPLSWAASKGHEAVVEFLLANERVDRNSRDTNGLTPLLWAGREGHAGVMKLLIQNGCRVDGGDKDLLVFQANMSMRHEACEGLMTEVEFGDGDDCFGLSNLFHM